MTDTVALDPEVQLPGVFARAIGIITSPKAMYEKIVQKPRVVGILALTALVMGGSQSAFMATERGQQAMVDMQMQQSEKFNKMFGREPSQEETDATYARLQKMAPIAKYTVFLNFFIGLPIGLLIGSAIFWAVFNAALGGTASFRQVMTVLAHSSVISSLTFIFGMIMAFARGSISTSPANLGLLLPMLPEGSFFANFLGVIDIFSIWGTIVTSIGLGVLYKRNSRNIAITLFSIWFVIVAGYAYFVSR